MITTTKNNNYIIIYIHTIDVTREDEHLLEDSYNIPETQHTDMSPTTFGTQLVNKLRIRSLPKERAEAANLNNTNITAE